jgi:UDP-N-acetylmuramate--alanine ligase
MSKPLKIYISGISGTGMGPLALMAQGAGMTVFGSDLAGGAVTNELVNHGIQLCLGNQDGEFLKARVKNDGVDWFVYTSALPADHPELLMAKKLKLKISKRDELLNYLLKKLKLKLIAVAGTHGKTTTTAMIVWMAQQLGIPLSYIIGTTLPFAEAGHYDPKSQYFVYEADEYDRNFLAFHPWLAVIPTVSYDHPDIYPTMEEYRQAFTQFEAQSETVIHGDEIDSGLTLAGEARRYDATLALDVIQRIMPKPKGLMKISALQRRKLLQMMNEFPGVGRRFEQVSEGYYSDYAHHPEEVAATVEIAIEEAERRGLKGVVAVYEPHQNSRQVELLEEYAPVFQGLTKLYWVPTFLTRENPKLEILKPTQFVAKLENKKIAEAAELNDELAQKLLDWHKKGYLVLLMSAGQADAWIRKLVFPGNQESAATRLVHAPRSASEEVR